MMNKRVIDTKVFKVLSYVFVFWLIVFFSPYINEKDVKFHVGQGMILSVFMILLIATVTVINVLVVPNVFANKIIIGAGTSGKYFINQTGILITSILRIISIILYLVFAIIGILNVMKGKDKFLPLIGRYSFINKLKWKEK